MGFPPITKNVILLCAVVFLAQNTFGLEGEEFFNDYLALHSVHSDYFRPYQIFTYPFLHANFQHLLFNALGLWVFGSSVEGIMEPRRFLSFLLVCSLGATAFHLGYLYVTQIEAAAYVNMYGPADPFSAAVLRRIDTPTVGVSGLVFGCMAAAGVLFPNALLYVYFVLPVATKWVVIVFLGYEVIAAVHSFTSESVRENHVAHLAHLGGALAGFVFLRLRVRWRPPH